MRCGVELTKLILKRYPELKKFVNEEGFLFCRLLKAFYGCIQASKLWQNKLMKFLKTQGYEQCPIDPCILQRIHGDKIYLLLVLVDVDDTLIIADAKEVQRVEGSF